MSATRSATARSGTAESPPTSTAGDAASRTKQLVCLVACLAQFMVVLDVAVVNVAIPT